MKNHNSIFRVRPVNENTLDELENCYLWFSKPSGFKGDTNDANIGAFVKDTIAIEQGFKYSRPEFPFVEWYDGLSKTGICCFTSEFPYKSKLRFFPGCTSGRAICIEYDRANLETFFERHRQYPIVPCFRKVQYAKHPTKIETSDEWSILWELGDVYKLYRTIPNILHSHPRDLDELLYKLLTWISSRFKRQKEERIILGAGLITPYDSISEGYKIFLPNEVIKKFYIYPSVSSNDKSVISKIAGLKDKLVFL